jgi:hypothetical protein
VFIHGQSIAVVNFKSLFLAHSLVLTPPCACALLPCPVCLHSDGCGQVESLGVYANVPFFKSYLEAQMDSVSGSAGPHDCFSVCVKSVQTGAASVKICWTQLADDWVRERGVGC